MKYYIALFLFFTGIAYAHAQDSTIHLSTRLFDQLQVMPLYSLDGWRFQEGNNPHWANPDINTLGWKKMKPVQVSKSMADKNGKVEGWFRIKIFLDSSFENMPLYLSFFEWAALDVYVDGKLIKSYGNTGIDGRAFKAPEHNAKLQVSPVSLLPRKEHIIAIHIVNYIPAFPLNLIEYEMGSYPIIPLLGGPAFITTINEYYAELGIYETISITVCFVLSLLFWLLAFQNPLEKNLRLIALCTTCFGMSALFMYIQMHGTFSLSGIIIVSCLLDLFIALMVLLILVILAKVFTNKAPRTLRLFLGILSMIGFYNLTRGYLIPVVIVVFIETIIIFYYLLSSWKSLKGAQWALVAGVIITFIWGVAWVISLLGNQYLFTIGYRDLFVVGDFLSFPLSLLVYVSFRFREIIREVRENARQLLQVTEEKRQQALNQQIILEQEVKRQTADLTKTLQSLKSTQSQLIQSKKMASLGELTAGIAHEIQNPLNFVNNFSEVNKELLIEMKEEIDKGDLEEVKLIVNDVISNEEKISHHGKRADSIVKGMLQHSKASTGKKDLIDVNALVEECIRLSYHGIRAKDKKFNVAIATELDGSIDKISVVPQDISRVLINLLNNAFYAVDEKKRQLNGMYEPAVTVYTKKLEGKVEIQVNDNGNGIPQNIVDKIFQPFFTTKPTGQGTGLGLSLSYDIIKAHGGEIKIESKEGEGSEFVIQLPLS